MIIEQVIDGFCDLANGDMNGIIISLQKEYQHLIKEKAAYHDAKEIIDSIKYLNIFPSEDEDVIT